MFKPKKYDPDEVLEPLTDRVLVRRLDPESRSKGGIIIPDVAKEPPMLADVLAVGPGKHNDKGVLIPMPVKVGDRVLIGKYNGVDHPDNEDLTFVTADQILGIVEK